MLRFVMPWMLLQDSCVLVVYFFFSSRRRHTRFDCDWSSDVCSSDLTSFPVSVLPGPARPSRPTGNLLSWQDPSLFHSCPFAWFYSFVRRPSRSSGVKIGRASCRERV